MLLEERDCDRLKSVFRSGPSVLQVFSKQGDCHQSFLGCTCTTDLRD